MDLVGLWDGIAPTTPTVKEAPRARRGTSRTTIRKNPDRRIDPHRLGAALCPLRGEMAQVIGS
jgi:hypothetical protein